jgi:hypothetical protein
VTSPDTPARQQARATTDARLARLRSGAQLTAAERYGLARLLLAIRATGGPR